MPESKSKASLQIPTATTKYAPTIQDRLDAAFQEGDEVNHPSHYNRHPAKIETIQVTEWFNFCIGNAIKYLWRAGLKDSTSTVVDLKKAKWYIERELQRLGAE